LAPTATIYEPLSPPATPAGVTVDEVLKAIDVPHLAAADALAWVTQRSCQLRGNVGRWSDRLMEMQRFKEWLGAPGWMSDMLLVDGHCGNVAVDKVSPMSAICASLVGVISSAERDDAQQRPGAVLLHHFCGQHLGSRDPLRGPCGLIRSLILQLLAQTVGVDHGSLGSAPSLEFIDEALLGDVRNKDVSSLCRLFCELVVRSSPARPIFCIIDGVSEIETVLHGCRDDACTVIDALLDLVEHDRAGPAVRVLLSSSERSTELAESVIPPDRRISLLAAHSLGTRSFPALFEDDVEELLLVAGEHGVWFPSRFDPEVEE
jgi:hypothetical protein